MKFEELFIQINEILHRSIQKFKEEIIGSGPYSEMTLSQLFYLEAVHSLGSPTLGELAKRLKVSNASASVGVQKLLKKGLLRKIQSSEDRRVFYISLSPDAKKLMKAEERAFADFIANIKSTLNEKEIRIVEEIFQKILNKYR